MGAIDGLHKYQLGCIETDYKLERKADSTIDIIQKLMAVFRLLVLGADANGIIQKIYNFSYVQQEWIEIRSNLLTEYDDTDTEKWNLILKMDLLLQNYDAVLNYLRLPDMYGLFFNGYWRDEFPKEKIIKEQFYGEQHDNKLFQETLHYSIKETNTQQLVNISIKGNSSTIDEFTYTGSCIFLDGALEVCKKKIENDTIKFNYSAKWVGLKNVFQL